MIQIALDLFGLPPPDSIPGTRGKRDSLDNKLEAVLPGTQADWSDNEREMFAYRLCGVLVDDVIKTLSNWIESNSDKEVHHVNDLLLWVFHDTSWLPAGTGYPDVPTVSFDVACRVLGLDAQMLRLGISLGFHKHLSGLAVEHRELSFMEGGLYGTSQAQKTVERISPSGGKNIVCA